MRCRAVVVILAMPLGAPDMLNTTTRPGALDGLHIHPKTEPAEQLLQCMSCVSANAWLPPPGAAPDRHTQHQVAPPSLAIATQ